MPFNALKLIHKKPLYSRQHDSYNFVILDYLKTNLYLYRFSLILFSVYMWSLPILIQISVLLKI